MALRKTGFELLKVISSDAWSSLVRKTYGRPYDFLQQEAGRYYKPERGLFPVQVDEDEDEDENGVPLVEWLAAKAPAKHCLLEELRWEREFYPRLQELVRDMIRKGVLDPGDFYINVSW